LIFKFEIEHITLSIGVLADYKASKRIERATKQVGKGLRLLTIFTILYIYGYYIQREKELRENALLRIAKGAVRKEDDGK
jgi:hypothetical protein